MKAITIQTHQKTEVINVTGELQAMVAGVKDGLVYFSVPHTTAAIILSEDDAALKGDLVKVAERLLASMRPFRHGLEGNPNAEAHLISALTGTTLVLAVENGRLDLGTWQSVLFLELDGPRSREIRCKVLAV